MTGYWANETPALRRYRMISPVNSLAAMLKNATIRAMVHMIKQDALAVFRCVQSSVAH